MAQIGIQTYEAYNTIDDCKRPGSLTVPPASIRRLQKAGEPNGNTAVKPTNLQNGSLLFDGGHGGRDHLPPAHQPQVLQPPGRRRILPEKAIIDPVKFSRGVECNNPVKFSQGVECNNPVKFSRGVECNMTLPEKAVN